MALTTVEKELLREAICKGAFSGNSQNQQAGRVAVNEATLEKVSAMSDSDIRAVLTLYNSSKIAQITLQISNAAQTGTSLAAQLAAAQAIVIGG